MRVEHCKRERCCKRMTYIGSTSRAETFGDQTNVVVTGHYQCVCGATEKVVLSVRPIRGHHAHR